MILSIRNFFVKRKLPMLTIKTHLNTDAHTQKILEKNGEQKRRKE